MKFDFKMKFEPKLLVWIAISPRGISKPYYAQSGLAINQQIQRDQCLKEKLLPMIQDLCLDKKYLFWPDLASAHYANSVTNFMTENNIKFLPKDENPAKLPYVRSIEDFWAHLKLKVYDQNWEAKTTDDLRNRIKYCLKKIDLDFVQKQASSTHKRINNISTNGIQFSQQLKQ